jgi:hypothetical protein
MVTGGMFGPRYVEVECSARGCGKRILMRPPALSWLCPGHNARVRQRCTVDGCDEYEVVKAAYVEPGWRCPRHRCDPEGEEPW